MSDVDGTYDVTINSPMGSQNAKVTLSTDGDALTGTLAGQNGSLDIQDGKVDGDTLTWSAQMVQPMPMKLEFTASVNGDEISGSVQLGAFGSAPFSGKRV